jgi:competence protein ComEC
MVFLPEYEVYSRTMKFANRTTLIALYCSGLLAGLGIVAGGVWLQGIVWSVVAIGLLLISLKRRTAIAVPAVVMAGLVCGLLRGTDMQVQLGFFKEHEGEKVVLRGTVIDDAGYGDKGQRDMRLQHVQLDGRSPPGVVRVTSHTLHQPRRGDVVEVSGKLREGFGNYQAAIYFGQLQVISVAKHPIDEFRHMFAAGIYSNMPDLQASLGLGVLMGVKTQLPQDLDEQLKILALTHIVVASGYNLTVLIRVARRLFEKRSKFQTAVAGGGLMATFVVVTGFSASMTRAALVTGLSLWAWYYGRRIHPVVILLVAAAITAGINPMYVWGDLGWYLSFLAFAGVLLVAPLLTRLIYGKREPKTIGQIVIETFSAQLTTLPLTLAIFGNLTILGLLANVMIVPLIPLAMLLTLVAGVGAGLGTFAPFIALPATWLLTYITQLISVLAAVPWAAVDVKISAVSMVGLYMAMLVAGILIWRKTKHDFMAKSVIE